MYLTSRLIDENKIYSLYRTVLLEQEGEALKQMDPATFAVFEEKLTKAKYRLYRDYPFFGILLSKLRTVPTDDVPTMAVDDDGNIYINPKFVINVLSDDETMGVLAHETMHIATLSFFRQRGRHMELWNIATDYIMNRDLLEAGIPLPSLGLIPQNRGGQYIVNIKGMPPIDITDVTAEELYDKLIQEGKKLKPGQPGQPGGPPGQPGGPGENSIPIPKHIYDKLVKKQQELDKHLNPQEADKIKPEDVPSDDPKYKPDKPPGGDKQGRQIEKTESSKDEAERTRGEGAGVPRSLIKGVRKTVTDWKRLLRKFVTSANTEYYDWSRPRKQPFVRGYYAPKIRQEQEDLDIVIAIDTSGSIGDDIINVFVNELLSIIKSFKRVNMNLLLWHTTVYKEVEINNKRKSFEQIQQELMNLPYQGGGTEISCIKKYLDKKKDKIKKIKGLLVFTDGEVEENPQFPNVSKKLFMITQNGTDEILKKYGPTFFVDVPHS